MSERAKHYADSDNITIEDAKDQIAKALRHARGREDAVPSKILAEMTGLKATTVRDLIPEIRRERGIPVTSCSKGYFRIVEQETFADTMQGIEETIETKKQRQKELAQAWYGQ